ncbi:hypothetical protein VTI74DRAFT_10089 [Chaetomium olivicolor]
MEPPIHDVGIPRPDGVVFHDIIIVGAGPCGLAMAARLREQNPAAIFTDEEHRRFHWMRRHGKKMALKHVKNGGVSCAMDTTRSEFNMVVLDADHDDWMGRWNNLFKTFDIKHLRSPMFWHVDPHDRDSLLSKAYEQGRENELMEIKGCVGKEVSKHLKKKRGKYIGCKSDSRVLINERDRKDYFNPTQALFYDHCSEVVLRYGLQAGGLVRKERVLDISFASVPGISVADGKLFTVRTDKGIRYSSIVVVAVGPGNQPRIPKIPGMLSCIRNFPDELLKQRIAARRHTNILIVGGGLTSAQLADLAIRKGVSTVWHMMRGPLRVKLFDVDLPWMGKFKNVEQSRFWQADSDEERLAFLKEARGGGSITPHYHKILRGHIASGRLRLFEHTSLVDARFDEGVGQAGSRGVWQIKTSPEVESLPAMDYIYFATGVETNFETLPWLQTMLKSHPIPGHGGFPCLNDDLMWKDGVPLFLAGRLAALKLGPSAPNLGGARLAAERIAWGIEDVMRKACGLRHGSQGGTQDRGEDEELVGYATGAGSMFRSLSEVSL